MPLLDFKNLTELNTNIIVKFFKKLFEVFIIIYLYLVWNNDA